MTESVETVVIGAGFAGIAASCHLAAAGCEHVVLERGRVAETWRTQRWDSFRLNTPAWMSAPPGAVLGDDARGFAATHEVVAALEDRAGVYRLPIETGASVTKVTPMEGGWRVSTKETAIDARNVVVASGAQVVPRVPGSAQRLPSSIFQLHAADYRGPDQLPSGAVLVVGSAQTGGQVAEELARSGLRTFLCASRVGRVPRRYRGRDMFEWWRDNGHWDTRTDEVDKARIGGRQPLISGVDGGHTLSLQQLERDGVTLLGRLRAVHGPRIQLAQDVAASVRFADEESARHKRLIDDYIAREGIDAPVADDDHADRRAPATPAGPATIDLAGEDVQSVIWCTGFDADLHYLPRALRPRAGAPPSPAPGLYAVGFPWLRSRKSAVFWGMASDAEWVARRIVLRGRAQLRAPSA